jgi:hypothetical protein
MKANMNSSFYSDFRINDTNGFIKLEGRFLSLEPDKLWSEIIQSSENLARQANKLKLVLNIEYISSSDIKYLYILLKTIDAARPEYSSTTVEWNYEEFDDDMKELGNVFQKSLGNSISFKINELNTSYAA